MKSCFPETFQKEKLVCEIGSLIEAFVFAKRIEEKRLLVRVIGRLEKSCIRKIGIPLLFTEKPAKNGEVSHIIAVSFVPIC